MARKAKKGYYKNTPRNIAKILKVLQDSVREGEEFMTLSELARRCSMHKWSVSRTIDIYMHPFIDLVQPPELEAIGLQVKIIKLKDANINLERIMSYYKLRSKINQ